MTVIDENKNGPFLAIPALANEENCPDSCWLSVYESSEQQAKENNNSLFAAIPALANKDYCPDSRCLLIYDSCGQQVKENKNSDPISLSKSFRICGQ